MFKKHYIRIKELDHHVEAVYSNWNFPSGYERLLLKLAVVYWVQNPK